MCPEPAVVVRSTGCSTVVVGSTGPTVARSWLGLSVPGRPLRGPAGTRLGGWPGWPLGPLTDSHRTVVGMWFGSLQIEEEFLDLLKKEVKSKSKIITISACFSEHIRVKFI